MSIAQNIAVVRSRIAAAAHRAGRNPEAVVLMAVSKTVAPAGIREAYAAGLRLFGESRVPDLARKAEALSDLPDTEWHMIGHLQANKSNKAAELFAAVDSVDSLRLARRLNVSASQLGKKVAVLLEINVGGEAAKSGMVRGSPELDEILRAAPAFENLEIRGLMTVPPFTDDREGARPYFRELRELQGELQRKIAALGLPRVEMKQLSMGMSHDFEVAIEEGSTCVRVGTAIFGDRTVTLEG
jgi:pyridoxal phosphate enzyme (YggS family)